MKRSQIFACLFLILVGLSLQACATTHSAKSIEAWVVDAETNQPLEGVIVVAHWQLERKFAYPPGVTGYDPRGPLQLKVLETVTDPQGRFYFPAWGPLVAPPGAYLEGFDPQIILFKPGYEYEWFANQHFAPINSSISSTRTSWVNGTTIKLKKFEGDLKGYADALTLLHGEVDFATNNCDWKPIPRMLVALDKQARLFREAKVYSSLQTIDYITQDPRGQCGSAQEIFKDYLK